MDNWVKIKGKEVIKSTGFGGGLLVEDEHFMDDLR